MKGRTRHAGHDALHTHNNAARAVFSRERDFHGGGAALRVNGHNGVLGAGNRDKDAQGHTHRRQTQDTRHTVRMTQGGRCGAD